MGDSAVCPSPTGCVLVRLYTVWQVMWTATEAPSTATIVTLQEKSLLSSPGLSTGFCHLANRDALRRTGRMEWGWRQNGKERGEEGGEEELGLDLSKNVRMTRNLVGAVSAQPPKLAVSFQTMTAIPLDSGHHVT